MLHSLMPLAALAPAVGGIMGFVSLCIDKRSRRRHCCRCGVKFGYMSSALLVHRSMSPCVGANAAALPHIKLQPCSFRLYLFIIQRPPTHRRRRRLCTVVVALSSGRRLVRGLLRGVRGVRHAPCAQLAGWLASRRAAIDGQAVPGLPRACQRS